MSQPIDDEEFSCFWFVIFFYVWQFEDFFRLLIFDIFENLVYCQFDYN